MLVSEQGFPTLDGLEYFVAIHSRAFGILSLRAPSSFAVPIFVCGGLSTLAALDGVFHSLCH